MRAKELRDSLRDGWRLAKPYWVSEERRVAWVLLAAVVALNLAQVGLTVAFNYWRNAFYNALQTYDEASFINQIGRDG